jgi:hypothetical protein
LQHVHLRQPARKAADDCVAEAQQPVHDAAVLMMVAARMNSGIGQQQEARIGPVEQLLGGHAHVHALEGQVQDEPPIIA